MTPCYRRPAPSETGLAAGRTGRVQLRSRSGPRPRRCTPALASPHALRHTETDVSEYCTCGAELPPDARFCHKCGKPQRDEPLLVEEPPAAPPPPPPVAVPLQIGFRNPLAFRIGFLSALLAFLLTLLVSPACPVWLAAAGFLGVYLYRRRSGESLSARSAAKMGWITGVLTFLVFSLPAVFAYLDEIASTDYIAHMRQQLNSWAFPVQVQNQMIASMQTPAGMAAQVVTLLVMLFALATLLPLLGSLVAGKVLGRK